MAKKRKTKKAASDDRVFKPIRVYKRRASEKISEAVQASQTRSRQVLEKHRDTLLSYPGIVGVECAPILHQGKTTREFGIVVYVENKRARPELSRDEILPSRIDGVRIDVVPCSLTPSNNSCSNTVACLSRARTLRGGLRIGGDGSEEFGTLAALGTVNNGELVVALTAAHVVEFSNEIGQPDASRRNNLIGNILDSELSNQMDAAIIQIERQRRAVDSGVAGLGGPVNAKMLPMDSPHFTPVIMVGACSGWRTGLARQTSQDFPVNYASGRLFMQNHIQVFSDQQGTPFNVGGDSGALLLSIDGVSVIGLVIAGGPHHDGGWMGLATPIHRILNRFGLMIATGQ